MVTPFPFGGGAIAFPWQDAFPLILLVLAALALASIPLLRALSRRRGAKPAAPVGPVEVPPEEAELVEGAVWACMRCGSTNVGMGGISQGMIPGAGDQFAYVCPRCRHRGPPLEFESVTAYRQFVKGLHEKE
ncbi:MAG TPA: hypothetical protein VM370_10385 [Candidatus Thermoplasmatota archaeon]|nr:hypothetical protein [Candidatus Thermoplasmatota archaeon]